RHAGCHVHQDLAGVLAVDGGAVDQRTGNLDAAAACGGTDCHAGGQCRTCGSPARTTGPHVGRRCHEHADGEGIDEVDRTDRVDRPVGDVEGECGGCAGVDHARHEGLVEIGGAESERDAVLDGEAGGACG